MLSIYDLACEGLRDPHGVPAAPRLSWRLGCDLAGADQAAYRLVVTSMADGATRWDTGWVCSSANEVAYAGEPLEAGETCVWFAMVRGSSGERAEGVPATFAVARPGERPGCALGPQRRGLVWTSDAALDDELERRGDAERLDGRAWREVLGVRAEGPLVRVGPRLGQPVTAGLAFAQGSMLLGRGLLVVRWERLGRGARLAVGLPPGMAGELALGGERREVPSGRHELVVARA